ncbi:hypothetical protein [Myxococcus phage Mx4 ts27htf-1hrm-1]|nr:hypothetical protein Mx4_p63 [Myxococcus phage Mx4]WNM70402.1 hypothetical protein [Myxococcus phage Mx4 ts27htf-1hrm-1]
MSTFPDFGTDISTFPTLDPLFALQSGPRVLGEALARIYVTPKGSDAWHPEYGRDLRRYLNEGLVQERLAELQAEAEEGAELDERVLSAAAEVSFNAAAGVLTLALRVTTAAGPFFLVFALSAESASLLTAR